MHRQDSITDAMPGHTLASMQMFFRGLHMHVGLSVRTAPQGVKVGTTFRDVTSEMGM